MEKKGNIVLYRERLDKTLALPDLTNEETLKTLVKTQLHSSEQKIEGFRYEDKAVETRAAEVSKFLDMLRSASADDSDRSKSRTGWKLKQDNEEFRVMYREGPEGTPFHTLLVEGYIDGPVDVCLCISWETSLYKKWWPQFTVPTFKILLCDCLQKVRIGEQLSRVRVKLSWPLSSREAVLHYYLFEYVQDDLIVVLLNTVSDSKNINGTLNGFKNEAIPEAKDVIRMDVVGGFALQKVTSERSYFRTIANMDIKLDFVPPSLINFISRQLIGSGFKLYQKAVCSKMDNDEEFIKALGDPLYSRLREVLYGINGSKTAMDAEELEEGVNILPDEDIIESKQDETNDVSQEDKSNYLADKYTSMNGVLLDNSKAHGEIEEADSEETEHIEEDDRIVNEIPIKEVKTTNLLKGKSNVQISSEVEQALETLEKAISLVRKYGFNYRRSSPNFAHEEPRCMEKGDIIDPHSPKLGQQCSENELRIEVSNKDILEGASQEALETNSHTPSSSFKEVNYNKVVPASPEQNVSVPNEASQVTSCSLENGASGIQILDQTMDIDKQSNAIAIQDMSSDQPKKSSRKKTYKYCCFLPPSRGKSSKAKSRR
ncbi:uncharacterized protein G2W53_024332 [Senna tora]|uniref:START domain-containing protein n=1 Tax=Senna tora TaxID=362788 RepID=A0A834TBE0_9FABA|nr:uncharacterized protein G2W53_024332 [Senna tora]